MNVDDFFVDANKTNNPHFLVEVNYDVFYSILTFHDETLSTICVRLCAVLQLGRELLLVMMMMMSF